MAAKAAAEHQAAAAAAKAKGKQAQETQKDKAAGGSTIGTHPAEHGALNDDTPPELDDWELSEGGLPEGSTLSGSKALMDDPPRRRGQLKEAQEDQHRQR